MGEKKLCGLCDGKGWVPGFGMVKGPVRRLTCLACGGTGVKKAAK